MGEANADVHRNLLGIFLGREELAPTLWANLSRDDFAGLWGLELQTNFATLDTIRVVAIFCHGLADFLSCKSRKRACHSERSASQADLSKNTTSRKQGCHLRVLLRK
jgi:hypothetical protein